MAYSSALSRVVIVSLMKQSPQSEACKGELSLRRISADAVRAMACMGCGRTLSQTEFAVTVIQRMRSQCCEGWSYLPKQARNCYHIITRCGCFGRRLSCMSHVW